MPVSGGFLGVDVFFVISGFVITQLILRQSQQPGGFSFSNFYRRRFRRLLPALGVMISTIAIVSTVILPVEGSLKKSLITGMGASTFVANWVLYRSTGGYFDLPSANNAMLHTWSLSIEEQFYFVFPIILLFLLKRAKRKRKSLKTLQASTLLLGSGSLLFFLIASSHRFDSLLNAGDHLFYNPFPRAWEFLVGTFVAVSISAMDEYAVQKEKRNLFVPMVILFLSLILLGRDWAWPNVWIVVPVLVTAYILRFGSGASGNSGDLLKSKILVFVGDRSYSLYLWHWPIIVIFSAIWSPALMTKVCAVLFSFLLAHLSYKLIENPIRRRRVGSRKDWKLASVSITLPVLISASALLIGELLPKSAAAVSISTDSSPLHLGHALGCHSDTEVDQRDMKRCIWNRGGGNPVYLFGDSQADQFTEAFKENSRSRTTTIATISSCPLNLNIRALDGSPINRDESRCKKYSNSVLRYLATADSGIVVLTQSDQYWREPNFALLSDWGDVARSRLARRSLATLALKEFVAKIQGLGFQVVIIETIPQFNYEPGNVNSTRLLWSPQTCSRLKILNGSCAKTMKLSDALVVQGASWTLESLVASSTRSQYISFRNQLCPKGICVTFSKGHWIYRDANHISVWESRALAPLIASALKN